jgi:hypothetical protein
MMNFRKIAAASETLPQDVADAVLEQLGPTRHARS